MRPNRRDNDLRRAKLFVAQGEEAVARQQKVIADLKRMNRSTAKAEGLLASLEHSLLEMRNYLEILQNLKSPPEY